MSDQSRPIVSDQKVQKALKYLAETDEPAAMAKAYMQGLEDQKKTILAVSFFNGAGSQGEKLKYAESSGAYKTHLENIENATYDYELLKNKRKTAELIVEVWRTCSANQRRGNI